jgi:hypothetical protein
MVRYASAHVVAGNPDKCTSALQKELLRQEDDELTRGIILLYFAVV